MSELEAKALQLVEKIEKCILLDNLTEASYYQNLLDTLVKLATNPPKGKE